MKNYRKSADASAMKSAPFQPGRVFQQTGQAFLQVSRSKEKVCSLNRYLNTFGIFEFGC
jgi:hypothetical protein